MKKNMTVYRFYLSFVPSPKQTNACIVLYSAFKRYLYGNRMLRWPCIATAANIIGKKNYTGKNKDKLRKQYAAQQMNG